MRRVQATPHNFASRTVMRLTRLNDLAVEWHPNLMHLVPVESQAELQELTKFRLAGMENLSLYCADSSLGANWKLPQVWGLISQLNAGDVVEATPDRAWLHVLYRETDQHHTVFLTNQCNSRCVMCSQPPTRQDDSWLVAEAIQVAHHMRQGPTDLGFTGGEPLLLGSRLREVLATYEGRFPGIRMEILTNGRLLGDPAVAKDILQDLPPNLAWLVPLYGHADFLHDYVVQANGAFDAMLEGLLQLQAHQQWIQLRVVLIQPVLTYLPALTAFISKNLPFVGEVALMGCEPIGFALAQREICQVDIRDWHQQMETAISHLVQAGIPPVIMNLPLCSLPRNLWPYATQSISDWKQTFVDECNACVVKKSCSGLFAWHDKGWRPTTINPIMELS